jgi:hypothetical protein
MTADESERERKKRAIFESMSKRGQQRILRLGYENWDPFQEPKDPREQIRGSKVLKANADVRQFLETHPQYGLGTPFYKDLVELCLGILRGESRSEVIFEFCNWYNEKHPEGRER